MPITNIVALVIISIFLIAVFKWLCLIHTILETISDAHVRAEKFQTKHLEGTLKLLLKTREEVDEIVKSRDDIVDRFHDLKKDADEFETERDENFNALVLTLVDNASYDEEDYESMICAVKNIIVERDKAQVLYNELREKYDGLALEHRNLLEDLARALMDNISFNYKDADDMICGVKNIIEERNGLRDLRKKNADTIQESERCRRKDQETMETAATVVNNYESRLAGIETATFNLASEEILDFAGIDANERANDILRVGDELVKSKGNNIELNIKAWAKRVARRVRTIADRRTYAEEFKGGEKTVNQVRKENGLSPVPDA